MDQKGHKITKQGWNILRRGFWTKNTCILRNFFSGILVTSSPLSRNWFAKQNWRHWPGGYHLHLEKSRHFWNHPENWQSSWKIWTVLKSSGKLAVIWKTPDSFEIIWKIGSHLKKSRQFWNNPENWQSSVKIQTVLKSSGKLAVIWKIQTVLK